MTDKIQRLYAELKATDDSDKIIKLMTEIKRCERKVKSEQSK